MMAETGVVNIITSVSTVGGVPDATSMGGITHLATHRTLGALTVPPTPTPTTGEPRHDALTSSRLRAEILGGVIGGAVCLMLIMMAMIMWWRCGRRCVRCRLNGRKSSEQVVTPEGHYAAENGTDARNRSTFYSGDPIDRQCLPLPLFDRQPPGGERVSSRETTFSEFLRRAHEKDKQDSLREKLRAETTARLRPYISTPTYELSLLRPNPYSNFSRPFDRGSRREFYNRMVNESYNDNHKLEQVRRQITTPTTLTTMTPRLPGQTAPPSSPDGTNDPSPELLDPTLISARYDSNVKTETSHPDLRQSQPLLYPCRFPRPEEAFFGPLRMDKFKESDSPGRFSGRKINRDDTDDSLLMTQLRNWEAIDPANKRSGVVLYPDRDSVEIEGSPSPVDDKASLVEDHNWAPPNNGNLSKKRSGISWFNSSPSPKPELEGNTVNAPPTLPRVTYEPPIEDVPPTLARVTYEPPKEDVPRSANAMRSAHEDKQDSQRFDHSKLRPATI